MAYPTPCFRKQNVYHFYEHETKQTSERNMEGWQSELNDKIVELEDLPLKDFLRCFVPSDTTLKGSKAWNPFDVPVGGAESSMYGPLCTGMRKLVAEFPSSTRPVFHNNAHEQIKFPFLLGEHLHHATEPDIIASLPGQTFEKKLPDRWRNISVVFEVKNTDSKDPMRFTSRENDKTLVQLAKSARNILVAQSRLFAFAVGIYGSKARIFRFDHAGAVCSAPFDYAAEHGAVLYEFLWRLVHPIRKSCDIVGADPTVRLVSYNEKLRYEARKRLLAGGVEIDNETMKACRWITVTDADGKAKSYLLYELVFMNPRLFSRATTIWKALELDDDSELGWPTGRHVIIKDAWRQLARKPETEFYQQIYAHLASQITRSKAATNEDGSRVSDPEVAEEGGGSQLTDAEIAEGFGCISEEMLTEVWGTNWPGLSMVVLGDDLGEEEELRLDDKERVGHRTCTGIYLAKRAHQWFERSHIRLVSNTVGTPISQFKSTKELVQVIRDAIHGHELAFEAGIMHRDISEGNVMIFNGRGFLHDLDYGFNWKEFLNELGYENTPESWEEFVRTEKGIPRDGSEVKPVVYAPPNYGYDTGDNSPPRPVVNHQGNREYFVEEIRAERRGENGREFYVKWRGYGDEHNDWVPQSNVEKCVALSDWLLRPLRERERLSECELAKERDGTARKAVEPTSAAPTGKAKTMMECKQRTGTFYFMAIEVLRRGVIHQVRHDLESFYWLLVWLVLRHTNHSIRDKYSKLKSLFDLPTDEECATHKRGWLGGDFWVFDNKPLSDLLDNFSTLCLENSHAKASKSAPKHLTYEIVLRQFDDALARPDWPTNDAAIPFKLAADPAHQEHCRSTWFSQEPQAQAEEDEGATQVPPPTAVLDHALVANPVRKASDGDVLLSWTARRSARAGRYPPRTPQRAVSSGLRHPNEPWTTSLRYKSDPNSPSPSSRSRRVSSAASWMKPPAAPLRIPSPPFALGVPPGSAETHVRAHPGENSQSSGSSHSMQGESNTARHSGRKRSHEELAANDEGSDGEPSKRSRTHSEQLPTSKALGKRPQRG